MQDEEGYHGINIAVLTLKHLYRHRRNLAELKLNSACPEMCHTRWFA